MTDDTIVTAGNEKWYTHASSGAENYIDPLDGKRRKATLADVKNWAILADGLDNIDHCSAPYHADVGQNLNARDVRGFEILMENSTKHAFMQIYGPKNLEFCIKLALAERGTVEELRKRPRFSAHMSPIPPLHYRENTVSMLLLAGEYGIPVSLCTMPLCGTAAPVTLAGSVLLALAEYLAAVVIHQLANPGAPILIAPRPEPVDMRTGLVTVGSIESAMMPLALTQVAKEGFGWPIDTLGSTPQSFLTDEQAIIESVFGKIFGGCGGTSILAGGGLLESGFTVDPALLVIDNEVYGMLRRAARGIEVNNDTLGLDVIREIGAGVGKTYLSHDHTLKYFRTEHYKPTLLSSSSRQEWELTGAKDLYEKARQKARNILETHKAPPLADALVKEVRSIAEMAEAEIKETKSV